MKLINCTLGGIIMIFSFAVARGGIVWMTQRIAIKLIHSNYQSIKTFTKVVRIKYQRKYIHILIYGRTTTDEIIMTFDFWAPAFPSVILFLFGVCSYGGGWENRTC